MYSIWVENASVFGSHERQFCNTLLNPNFLLEVHLINFYFSLHNAELDDVLNVEYAE